MALISIFHLSHADTLVAENISVRESIQVSSDAKIGKAAVLPLTIANVLYLLDLSGTANDMRYYFDTTEHGYVIAPKADRVSGQESPVAILLTILPSGTLGTNYLLWNPE